MTAHLPILMIVVPLAMGLASPVLAMLSTRLTRALVLLSAAATLGCAAGALQRTLEMGESWSYWLAGWPPPWGIEYVVDPLAGGLNTLIAFLALVTLVYAGPYLEKRTPLEKGTFYALFLLTVAGLMGMVITGDMFNLYVFLEICSLTAYALIASGGRRATVAAIRYLIIGSAAACMYLLGLGYVHVMTGSLNMADLMVLLPPLMADSPVMVLAVVLMAAGLGIKVALFPLHGWLPDTYSYTPAPVLAFIAAVMTKVAAYALYRIFFFVFAVAGPVSVTLEVMGWLAAAGILFGSIMAIAQRDLWRMLAYSSVAQVAYIVLGLAIGNSLALIGALLHIVSHSVVKGLLFLIAGGVKWQTGLRNIPEFVGMARHMPWTMGVFVIAAMSMIGLPPTIGFFSKWYLILGAVEAGAWVFVAVLIASSLLTAIYFFRAIEFAYLKGKKPEEVPAEAVLPARAGLELPVRMLVPILVLGVGVVLLGLFNEQLVTNVIQYALPWRLP
ncbi:MAG: monovalent cation/H+ antiporter subunit D family protein [Candidatus Desulforudis sp.]|nr:monovalent cation/H+ antiporter subunit D family protein [Desulforudis sp.]